MIDSASLNALAGMVRPIAYATTRLASPSTRNSCDVVMPASCRPNTMRLLTAMKAALSTLTAAMTRARRSAPAQACTAAKVGTMKRPPAMASPARSTAKRILRADVNIAKYPEMEALAETPRVDQPRSAANTPSSTAPMTVGSRTSRPAQSQAASPEPSATETVKIARQVVTTSASPPSALVTRGGISDSATAPTSQNQLVTSAPHHSRESSRRKLSNPKVETSTLRCTTKCGAPSPVGGIKRLAPQHSSENTIMRSEN